MVTVVAILRRGLRNVVEIESDNFKKIVTPYNC